jgi:hypothetical protein
VAGSAYGFGFGGLSMHRDVVDAGLGVVAGGVQAGVTMAIDATAALGTSWAPQIGTNGQIINLGTGLVATALGVTGLAGKWVMGRHAGFSSFLFGYGLTAVLGGWLIPFLVKGALKASGKAGAAFGVGYPPPPTPSGVPYNSAPQATRDNLGIVSALSS